MEEITIKDLVKNKRRSLGENQTQFAQRFGLSRTQIANIEGGTTKVISERMLQLVLDQKIKRFASEKCSTCKGRGIIIREINHEN